MVILKDNYHENPYSALFHYYLKRQLTLVGNMGLIEKVDVGLLFSMRRLTVRPVDPNEEAIGFESSYNLTPENREERTNYLKGYLKLSLVAQQFEAFETFLKDTFRKYLVIHVQNESLLAMARKSMPRTNKELVKALVSVCPKLQVDLNEDFFSWFHTIEVVRHRIIHNDQTFDDSSFSKIDKKKSVSISK